MKARPELQTMICGEIVAAENAHSHGPEIRLRWRRDCSVARVGGVAEGAVWSEPVSKVKFPVNQGKYREFDEARRRTRLKPELNSVAYAIIPCRRTGNFLPGAGNF
jgi:hypothetical protein